MVPLRLQGSTEGFEGSLREFHVQVKSFTTLDEILIFYIFVCILCVYIYIRYFYFLFWKKVRSSGGKIKVSSVDTCTVYM